MRIMPYMEFQPKSTDTIYEELIARWLTRSPATDVTEGSVVSHINRTFAEALSSTERRMWSIREAFDFRNATGADLDRRLEDLPPGFESRIGATVGTGGNATLTRADDGVLAEWTLNAPATFKNSASGVVYETISNVTFANGALTATEVALRSRTPGTDGNCLAGKVDSVIQASDGDGQVISVLNTLPITNAIDEETDDQLIQRALLFLAGLTSNTVQALSYLGSTFTASDGSKARQARVYEDPDQFYVELLVDDGSALAGYSAAGAAVAGTIPTGNPGGIYLYHESPAVSPIVSVIVDGVALDAEDFISYPEQGRVRLLDTAGVSAGDAWSISGYTVWTGLPRELQEEINDNRKPAGGRIRVVAPTIHWVNLDLNVIPVRGSDFDLVQANTVDAVINYLSSLSPGETLFMSRLYDVIHNDPLVRTVRVFSAGTSTPSGDIAPTSPRHVIRTNAARLNVVPLPA